jgi:hypothetical protein
MARKEVIYTKLISSELNNQKLFIKLGYGLDGYSTTSLEFLTDELLAEEACEVVKMVDSYNEFYGEEVAEVINKIAKLWPSTHQQVTFQFGREHSPVLYVHFPYWKSVTERFENRDELIKKSLALLRTCNPDELDEEYSGYRTRAWWD